MKPASFDPSRSGSPAPQAFDARWIAAAQYERDRRAEKYPERIAAGQVDEEWANADYQAWCAIAEWMETGSCALIGNWGGIADPPVTILSWALLEASAFKALQLLDAKLGNSPADQALRARHDSIFCIHALMVRQREMVEITDRLIAKWRAERPAQREKEAA